MSVEHQTDEVTGWHVRLSNPAATAEDWASFTEWLEVDPANAEAYDSLALCDAELSDALKASKLDTLLAQNDDVALPSPWYRRGGVLALAASAAVALLVSPAYISGRDLKTYETVPGEMREIVLTDGSQIAMNGGTRLQLVGKTGRFARLEAGEAMFIIKHDAANPFVVETTGSTLRDMGTSFNVRQEDDQLDVTVATGAVQYNPRQEAVTVTAGNRLQVSRTRPVPIISKAEPGSVAGWREGNLTYHDAPFKSIATDLTRSLGVPVSVSSEVANRRFTGVIRVDRDSRLFFNRLEPLLGVRVRHTAQGWQLTS